ncbi:MAG: nickel-dependent lactate racemase [Acetivibrionales bacterium]
MVKDGYIQIQYGDKIVEVNIPEKSIIACPSIKDVDKISDIESELLKSLRNPVGSLPLYEVAKGRKNAVVVIPDITRPMPTSTLLPIILDELNAGGLEDCNIKAIIALGTHRPMTQAEIQNMVGQDVLSRIEVKNHAWNDERQLVCLGRTANGTWIDVNREVYEADLVIGLSSVKPHRGAGWSGGAKIIDPGVCGKRTIGGTHYMTVDFANDEVTGVLDNPIRKEIEDVAKKVGLEFSTNLVLNKQDEVAFISSGDVFLSHKKAVEFAEKIFRDPQTEKGDFLICGAGAWAPDFWTSVQGIFPAEYLVKDGGTVAIFTPCTEGIAKEHPQIEEFGYRPVIDTKEMVSRGIIMDLAAAGHMAAVSRVVIEKNIECIVVSDKSNKQSFESLGFRWMETPQAAVDYIFNKHKNARGYVFPVKSITDTVVIPW